MRGEGGAGWFVWKACGAQAEAERHGRATAPHRVTWKTNPSRASVESSPRPLVLNNGFAPRSGEGPGASTNLGCRCCSKQVNWSTPGGRLYERV